MKKLGAILCLGICAGCLTATSPINISDWPVQVATLKDRAESPKYGVARLSQVSVRAPYDVKQMAVLRADRSLAFDPYNHFAAQPSQLLKGLVQDALASSGYFKAVVPSSSAASVSEIVEVTISSLRLNCASDVDAAPIAEASVTVLVLNGSREIVGASRGSGLAEAGEGDYGAAFSKAITNALSSALGGL